MDYTRLIAGQSGVAQRSAIDEVIRDFDLSEKRRKWLDKKMIVFGDSIWSQGTIQPELIRLLGVTYDNDEAINGSGGFWPTVVPGTGVGSPSVGGANDSMYIRASDIHQYAPDLIITEGGVNDTIGGSFGPLTYNHTDAPYTGLDPITDGASYISCLKGMLQKLITNNPLVPIVFMGRYIYETAEPSADTMARIMARQAADEYCCRWAGVTYIDPLKMGIGFLNAASYMSSTAHPNTAGGILLAHAFAKAASII